jgi:hypothetical protein
LREAILLQIAALAAHTGVLVMKRQVMVLCAAMVIAATLFASSAQAQWGHYRVTSSYSLPSVPYAFQPVIVPAVQPTTAFSPVIVNQSLAVSQPIVASQPVVVGRPVIVGRPVVVGQPVMTAPVATLPVATAPVVVRRGLFRRPVVVAPGVVPVASVPAPIVMSPTFSARPVIVQRPAFWVP